MKKERASMKKKFISLLLVLTIVTSISVTIAAAGQTHDEPSSEEMAAMDAGVDAIHGENFSISERSASRQLELIQRGFTRTRDGRIIYPDFYAGSAFDYDGMAIIYIVESRFEEAYNHDTVGALLGAGLRYELVEFSYDELLAVAHEISSITLQRYTAYGCRYSYNVTLIFPDIRNNNVTVRIVEYNEDMIEGFRRYIYDAPILVLQQSGRITLGGGQGSVPLTVMMWTGILIIVIGIATVIIKKIIKK